jgi:DUF4097 and DUF4098 domain-containing protein YvlB
MRELFLRGLRSTLWKGRGNPMPKDPTHRQASFAGRFAFFAALFVPAGIFAVTAGALPDKLKVFQMGGDIDIAEVPDGATLRTMGGNIHVGKAHSDISLTTMGGNIEIDSADASVKATTMAGNIDAILAKGQSSGSHDITLSSNSGEIILTVPKDYPMTVEVTLAYTNNSSGDYKITDNFGLEQNSSKEWDRLHGTPRKYLYAKGRTGNGQNHVTIKTINGDVIIKEAHMPL